MEEPELAELHDIKRLKATMVVGRDRWQPVMRLTRVAGLQAERSTGDVRGDGLFGKCPCQ